jgi:cobalt/nickel transport system permease protein
MHIPDGFLDIPAAATTGAVSLGVVGYAVRRTGKNLGERTIPLLGVVAAFIFAAQMLNFPVVGGTSGHFLGAVFAVALLGPWAASVVMTVVLFVQALAMADGGITALGANVLNMGVVAVFLGFGLFQLFRKLLPRTLVGFLVSAAVASWASVVLGAVACSLELAVSGTVPLSVTLPPMVSVHMIIGLGEALITAVMTAAVLAARPDLVKGFDLAPGPGSRAAAPARMTGRMRSWAFIAGALVLALALAVFVSPFVSRSPDGLERVAMEKGFETAANGQTVWTSSPLGDYQMPGIGNVKVATAVAGLVGTIVLLAVVLVLGRLLSRRRSGASDRPGPA